MMGRAKVVEQSREFIFYLFILCRTWGIVIVRHYLTYTKVE